MNDLSDDENTLDYYKQALQLIIDISLDYDGYGNNIVELRSLVDELRTIASDGLQLKRPQYVNNGKVYEFINGNQSEVPIEHWTSDSKFFVEHLCSKEK